jgi:hypothetical protein
MVAGSRPLCVLSSCREIARPPLGLSCGTSWAGGTRGRPSGEIRDETPEPVGAESALNGARRTQGAPKKKKKKRRTYCTYLPFFLEIFGDFQV